MNPTKADALQSLCPGAEWVLQDDVLMWLDAKQAAPTEAEIDAEVARLIAEQPWEKLRAERNRRLAETDWVTLQAVDASVDGLGVQLPVLWMTYRQELRDLPANTTDPANPVWPIKPGGTN